MLVAINETQLVTSWTPASAGVTLNWLYVIPAKAGGKRRLRSRSLVRNWIPAYAGMVTRC